MAVSPLLVLAVGSWLQEHPEKKEERPADASTTRTRR
jgi:hypothetical protein